MIADLRKKALFLSWFTVGYNVLEGLISILAGRWAGSVALVGFGLDSFIESLSGGIMIWRFTTHGRLADGEDLKIEKKATRLVAVTFFVLGAYVLYESLEKFFTGESPDPSLPGMIIAIVSLIIMPVLFVLKKQTGRKMNSTSLRADARQTLACAFLSVALLLGLGLNYLYGFWQADPLVGLLIVVFLFKEGYKVWREGTLCSC